MDELRIRPIRNGTVIDHISQGQAVNVLKILGIDSSTRDVVSVGMNVNSDRLGRKDIVKTEGREIDSSEADIISMIAPTATVNVIRDFEVKEKYEVSMPDEIVGLLECQNQNCVTNTKEPVKTRFDVVEGEPRCSYCDEVLSGDITQHLL